MAFVNCLWNCIFVAFTILQQSRGNINLCYVPWDNGMTTDLLFRCYNEAHFKSLIQSFELAQVVPVVIIVENDVDIYSGLYIGWLADILRKAELNLKIILYDCQGHPSCNAALAYFIASTTPSKSIIVTVQHSVRWNLEYLISVRGSYNLKTVLLHLNHEQPWKNETDIESMMIHASSQQISSQYQKLHQVFRNYYYKPLVPFSYFLPVGIPFYGIELPLQSLPNTDYSIDTHIKPYIRASDRSVFCILMGRFEYDIPSIFHSERQQILEMVTQDQFPCLVQKQTRTLFTEESIRAHRKVLLSTVFAPCPAGNNPETFRHYEALEAGAIPIFVKPPSDMNFLAAWENYPGPVLDSWAEFPDLISSLDPRGADEVQRRVVAWYWTYKNRVVAGFRERLRHALES